VPSGGVGCMGGYAYIVGIYRYSQSLIYKVYMGMGGVCRRGYIRGGG